MKIKLNSYKILFRLLDSLSNSKLLHKLVINQKIYLGASIISLSLMNGSCSSDKPEAKNSNDKKNPTIDNLNGNEIPKNKKDSISRKKVKAKSAGREIEVIVNCYDVATESNEISFEPVKSKSIITQITNIKDINNTHVAGISTCYACVMLDPLPEFGKGDTLFQEYLKSSIVIPKGTEHISGIMYLEFVITKSGNIEDIIVRNSLHPDLDKEVIRVLNNLPNRFWPHKSRHFETTKYSLPIKFPTE